MVATLRNIATASKENRAAISRERVTPQLVRLMTEKHTTDEKHAAVPSSAAARVKLAEDMQKLAKSAGQLLFTLIIEGTKEVKDLIIGAISTCTSYQHCSCRTSHGRVLRSPCHPLHAPILDESHGVLVHVLAQSRRYRSQVLGHQRTSRSSWPFCAQLPRSSWASPRPATTQMRCAWPLKYATLARLESTTSVALLECWHLCISRLPNARPTRCWASNLAASVRQMDQGANYTDQRGAEHVLGGA